MATHNTIREHVEDALWAAEDGPTSLSGYDLTPLRGEARERAAVAADLNDEERRILFDCDTERPGSGLLLRNTEDGRRKTEDGTYACTLCGLQLFDSQSKFR
jgi:peptide-methionine (R)-S-oxide reductase